MDLLVGSGVLREGVMNTSGKLASRSVLKDFTDNALTIPAGNLFRKGTTRTLKACWRRWDNLPVDGTYRRNRVFLYGSASNFKGKPQ